MLYLLGLSYAMVSSALEAFGVYLCKSRVYDAVRIARTERACSIRTVVFDAIQRPHHRGALLHVHCMGRWLPLALCIDQRSELVLSVTPLSTVEIATLQDHITPLVRAMGGHVVIDAGDGGDRRQGTHHGTA